MSLVAKLIIALAAAVAAGYFTYGPTFAATWLGTLHEYGPQYRLTVLHHGASASTLTGVDVGQYNATQTGSSVVQLTPELGGPALTVRMNVEPNLKSLNVFWNGKYKIATPVDAIGGRTYWSDLAIAAGCIAGIIAAVLVLLGLTCFFPAPPKRPRPRQLATCG